MAKNVIDFFKNLKDELKVKECEARNENRDAECGALILINEVAYDISDCDDSNTFYIIIDHVGVCKIIAFWDDVCILADYIEEAFDLYYESKRYDQQDFKNHIQRAIFDFYKSCKFINY